jgi:hypothetical protein
MDNKKVPDKNLEAICSVTDLCKNLGLSRAQFYNLQNMGIFPKGLKDERTGRPYFDMKLQRDCHQIRSSGIGHNGQPYLFYSPRTNPGKSRGKGSKSVNGKHKEYISTLEQMGLDVTGQQVVGALKQLYPDGINGTDEGIVIRELFRHLKGM